MWNNVRQLNLAANALHALLPMNYALIIILLTVIIKLIFWQLVTVSGVFKRDDGPSTAVKNYTGIKP